MLNWKCLEVLVKYGGAMDMVPLGWPHGVGLVGMASWGWFSWSGWFHEFGCFGIVIG